MTVYPWIIWAIRVICMVLITHHVLGTMLSLFTQLALPSYQIHCKLSQLSSLFPLLQSPNPFSTQYPHCWSKMKAYMSLSCSEHLNGISSSEGKSLKLRMTCKTLSGSNPCSPVKLHCSLIYILTYYVSTMLS